MKKLLTFFFSAAIMLGLIIPAPAPAQTSVADQLKRIEELTAQIRAIQTQIQGLQTQQQTIQQSANQAALEILQGLGQGSEGDKVKVLQTLLSADASLYPEGLVTGFYGPATRRAIERFQRKNGLEAVGFIGPKTWNELQKLFRTEFKELEKIDDDDFDEDVADEIERYLGSLPTTSGTCVIPTNPFSSSTPFIGKNGKVKIISNGNTLIYQDGKHKVIITPNSYIEKDGKKQLLITPGVQIMKDGKSNTIIRCNGTGTTTFPFPFPTPNPTPNDTTAPVISSITSSPTHQSATVTWITNEVATGKIYYGTTSPLNLSTASTKSDGSLQTGHSFSLTSLQPNTTYYFVLESKDKKGNTATSSQRSFVTTNAPDTVAPLISAISFSGVSTSSATITWTTNEGSNSKVYYSTTSPLNSTTALTKIDSALVTGHSVTLTGLNPGTTYFFKVESTDGSSNTTLSSETSFGTSALPPSDTTAPIISGVGITPASTTATILWTTNEVATTKVYYGTVTPLATSSALTVSNTTLVTSHSAGLTGLTASTTYYMIVESKDAANNTSVSSEVSFTTTN